LTAILTALLGCKGQAGSGSDPFFGRTTVPPPATGAAVGQPVTPIYSGAGGTAPGWIPNGTPPAATMVMPSGSAPPGGAPFTPPPTGTFAAPPAGAAAAPSTFAQPPTATTAPAGAYPPSPAGAAPAAPAPFGGLPATGAPSGSYNNPAAPPTTLQPRAGTAPAAGVGVPPAGGNLPANNANPPFGNTTAPFGATAPSGAGGYPAATTPAGATTPGATAPSGTVPAAPGTSPGTAPSDNRYDPPGGSFDFRGAATPGPAAIPAGYGASRPAGSANATPPAPWLADSTPSQVRIPQPTPGTVAASAPAAGSVNGVTLSTPPQVITLQPGTSSQRSRYAVPGAPANPAAAPAGGNFPAPPGPSSTPRRSVDIMDLPQAEASLPSSDSVSPAPAGEIRLTSADSDNDGRAVLIDSRVDGNPLR
jgi:hypothetical protein